MCWRKDPHSVLRRSHRCLCISYSASDRGLMSRSDGYGVVIFLCILYKYRCTGESHISAQMFVPKVTFEVEDPEDLVMYHWTFAQTTFYGTESIHIVQLESSIVTSSHHIPVNAKCYAAMIYQTHAVSNPFTPSTSIQQWRTMQRACPACSAFLQAQKHHLLPPRNKPCYK